jgi:hypothetical protein
MHIRAELPQLLSKVGFRSVGLGRDPMLVAGLLREEVRVLIRLKDGRIRAVQPEVNPRGTGVAGVLTSPLYGLESQLDNFSLRTLKRIYEVSLLPRSEHRMRHLKRLRKLLPALETAETSPDPYRNIARDAYPPKCDCITYNIMNGCLQGIIRVIS